MLLFQDLILQGPRLHISEISNALKNIWICSAVGCATKRLVGFQIGTRETKHFQEFLSKISHIDAKFYASDHWHAYNLIDPTKHLAGKAHTTPLSA